MPPNRALVDSSFLYMLYNPREPEHAKAVEFVKLNQSVHVIPDVVLTEVAYLFNRFGGERAVVVFLETLEAAQPQLEPVTLSDIHDAREIMAAYYGSRLDFVDCCIMTLAERLNVTQIYTLDRRDFSIFRPRHCDYLELLP